MTRFNDYMKSTIRTLARKQLRVLNAQDHAKSWSCLVVALPVRCLKVTGFATG